MTPGRSFFRSTIGLKVLTALSGIVLIAFVTGHLVGNLQVFSAPDKINGYAHYLQSLGPTLWVARVALLVILVVHIWATTVLTMINARARGPAPRMLHTIQATLASRLMRWTGVVVLAFLIYHLAHFSLGLTQAGTYKSNLPPYTMDGDYHVFGIPVVASGTTVLDVHTMVVRGFQNPLVSAFYIIAIGLLSFHLLHGFESLFQTLGWRSHKWGGGLRRFVQLYCLLYFLGNLLIPGAVLLGRLQPHPVSATPVAVVLPR